MGAGTSVLGRRHFGAWLGSRCACERDAVRCDADERQRLEQLCRYFTRPALANERVQINSAGQVVLKLKTVWCDGTTHIVMSPLEFMQRLAMLVPGQQFGDDGFKAVNILDWRLELGA